VRPPRRREAVADVRPPLARERQDQERGRAGPRAGPLDRPPGKRDAGPAEAPEELGPLGRRHELGRGEGG
ncbi:hypothetical protein THAOC_29833, partial [Thalassiosira oceanica]